MPNKIDLHMHSTASDGTDTPLQLAEIVQSAGITIFALTDHDTVAGAEQLRCHTPAGMKFVPGIEFSCRMPSGKCHILGYACDTTHSSFQEALAQGAALRAAKLQKRIDFLKENGICLPENELEVLRKMPSVGKPHLGNLMVRYGFAPDMQTAISATLNRCPTHNSRIPAEVAVQAILASGGIPVWAHPLGGTGEKAVGKEQFGEMLEELMGYGLRGLECFYSKYPMSSCESLSEITQDHGLLVSGGSDYHGKNKSVRLGTLNEEETGVELGRLTILQALGISLPV